MTSPVKVKVHVAGGEGIYITIEEDTTAAEVLAEVLPQIPESLHSSNYAVFLRLSRSTEYLCERMLSAFECPLKIVTAHPSEIQFIHIVEKQEQGFKRKLSAVERAFESPLGLIVHQGNLKKRYKDSFQPRYALLDRNHFHYALDKEDLKVFCKSFALETITARETDTYGKYCFEIHTPHKTFVFKATNKSELTTWLSSINRQSRIVVENIVFETLNERIQLAEKSNSESDEALVRSCFDFTELMQNSICRENFYATVPDKKLVKLLKLIEKYAETKPSNILDYCQEVLTLMYQLYKQGSKIIPKPLLGQKLSKFFELKASGELPSQELFQDIYASAIQELRSHTFEEIKQSRLYEHSAHRLPADSLVAKHAQQ
mmetsp:Transcript_13560/g.25577  ORF Transcript_13560/g.25577 Transcript_13560/m.25577 type:complete len:374 (-) Transcript_13560:71-1192(-)